MLFVAEAYWDLEWQLLQLGFDHCYDKRLYDRLVHETPAAVRNHLDADVEYERGMVRFIENHDEPRAAAVFPPAKARAAAFAILTLPGARLLHEGQFEGRKVRLPVFLGRRPYEEADGDLQCFYDRLLESTGGDVFRSGEWRLCDRSGWPDNQTALNLLSWCWTHGDERCLVVINFSDTPAGGTRIDVMISYRAPLGVLGERLSRLLTPLFKSMVEKDIEGFKHFMENLEKVH